VNLAQVKQSTKPGPCQLCTGAFKCVSQHLFVLHFAFSLSFEEVAKEYCRLPQSFIKLVKKLNCAFQLDIYVISTIFWFKTPRYVFLLL
jgi:hypothetical protein